MLIELTTLQEKPLWVNPNNIAAMRPYGHKTLLYFLGGTEFDVLESPAEIAALCSPQDATQKALTAAREALERAEKGYQNLIEFRCIGDCICVGKDDVQVVIEELQAALAAIKEVSR